MPDIERNSATTLDIGRVLIAANEQFGKTIDWDARGTAITQLDVLFFGAYSPAVVRALNAVALRGKSPIEHEEFVCLAKSAFAAASDRYFNDEPITDYSILLDGEIGSDVLKLAQLVAVDPAGFSLPDEAAKEALSC
jgi:hypothetical protein